MSEVPEKRVLAQDLPQYQQSQRARTIAQQKEAEAQYQREVAEIEKQNLSEQQRYEAELEAYKKATQKQREADALKVEYDTEIRKLEEEKADAIARAHSSVWGPGGSRNRSDLNTKLNKIEKQYDNKINKVREQKRVTSGVAEYYLQNPESKLDTSVLRRFQETGSSFNLGILQSQKDVAREARTEYSRQAGVTTARSEAGKIQSAMAEIGTTQGSYGLGEGSERAAAVRPTPDTTAGKKAVESRRPLINVKTVENIYGGQQIETNPRAFVASLTRQDVSSSTGKPTEPQTIFSFQNITDVKEESGRTLLEFQSQLKTRTAPSATVYKGILEERGLPLTPLSKRIIDTYSSKGLYRDYKEPTAAKGKKGIVSKDGEKIFDIGTGMGDVRIGKEFGFVYDYNLQRPTEEKPVLFEGTLQYALSPKVQGPPKPRYEEVVAVPGTLEYAVQNQTKPTPFNKLVESQYNKLGELQEVTTKRAKSGNIKDILVQVGYAPSEAVRSVLGAGAFLVNVSEQYADPFIQEKLGLKRTVKPEPINLKSEVSGTTILPYDFEAQKWSIPILDKSYELRQREAIEKRGLPSYVFGVGFDYYGLKGAPSVVRGGLKIGEKLIVKALKPTLPTLGKAAREAALLQTGGRIRAPSTMWDIAEPPTKVGLRIEKPKGVTWGMIKAEAPKPSPFGKERVIPYEIRQGLTKTKDIVQTAAGKIGKRIPTGTPILLKNFGDISLNPAHLGTKPNIPARREISPPPEYKRTYPDLQRMRDMFYPNIPESRPKASVIPPGFVKVRPKLITAKASAKKIIGIPEMLKTKITLSKPKTPDFVIKSQREWKGFVFMQKKRLGEFKQGLPTLPRLPANQFVTFQRKGRDIKSGILETKRLSLQLFEWPAAKKQIIPAFSKQELKNLTREDIGVPSKIKTITSKKPRPLSFGIAPAKSPPFMEGFIEKPFRARRGKSPIEISFRSDVSGLGSVTPRPQSFFEMRKRFPRQPVEFDITPKGTGMDALKGTPAKWPDNWMLKQRKVSSQDYLYRLEKIKGKREWVEYPKPKMEQLGLVRSALPSKATRITSERFRQMPKMDPSWPKPPKPVQGDEFMNQLIALRRQPKESSMLFSDPKRTGKINTRLLKQELDVEQGLIKLDWPEVSKSDVSDYLSQKRSMRKFGKTEMEKMLKGVGGAGASSYGPVGFKRFGKQIPTTLFVSEKATPPIRLPTEKRTGMFRMLERSKEEQERLDKAWGQQMGRVLRERKKGDLPEITTRIDDTAESIRGKAKLSFVSEPMRITPIVIQRGTGIFDRPISIRRGRLARGEKPVETIPDRYREMRTGRQRGGKPMSLAPWKAPKLPEPKESNLFFTRQRAGRNVLRDDIAQPSITPASILEKQKFTKIELKLGKGKADTFGRKFEKSPLDSPVKDPTKGRTNWDKLESESRKTKAKKNKDWEESQKGPRKGAGQILAEPETNPLKLPEPEIPIPESFSESGAKIPYEKKKKRLPVIIPPIPKETKKQAEKISPVQTYDEIVLSDYRPKIATAQTSRLSIEISQPQKVQESFRMATVQPLKITTTPRMQTRQKPRQIPKTIQVPDVKLAQRQKQMVTPKQASPLAPKAPTKLSAPVMPKLRQPIKQIQFYKYPEQPRPPKRAMAALLPDEGKIPKSVLKKEKEKADFLGASSELQISGLFKRQEITYGQRKISKLLKGDVRVVQGKPRSTRRSKEQKDMLGFSKKKSKNKTRFW